MNYNNENGFTLLVWASWYRHDKCVEALIKSGADVNKTFGGNNNALMLASGQRV